MSRWGPELFESAAPYYARYRRYPDQLYDVLAREMHLTKGSRLLDLGCGTGQIAIPLAPKVHDVVALDPDPEMLAEAARVAKERMAGNIVFVRGYAEDLTIDLGTFNAVTIGTALHWMDREKVIDKVYEILEPGGTFIACGAGGDHERYEGPDPRPVYGEVIKRYLGPERRAGAATFTQPLEHHEAVIARSRFGPAELQRVPSQSEQTIADIVGLLFSTSFANRKLLGKDADAFERDITSALLELNPEGIFRLHTDYEVRIARKL